MEAKTAREQAVKYLRFLQCEVSDHGATCAEFAARFYGGLHHFPLGDRGLRSVNWQDDGHLSWTHYGELATFDGSELTVMVLLAHDLGLRLTVQALSPRYLRVGLGKRDVDGCFSGFLRHPTMEEVLAGWRAVHPPRTVADDRTVPR